MGILRLFAQPDPEAWLPPRLDAPLAGGIHFMVTALPDGTPVSGPCNCHLEYDHDTLGDPAR